MNRKYLFSWILFFTLSMLVFVQPLWAQKGTIVGTVSDATTGEKLLGATVVIKGTTTGAVTDLDGKYRIELEPGVYDLQCTFIAYEPQDIAQVQIVADKVQIRDIAMGESQLKLDEVVILAKAVQNTEASVLNVQKKASVVLDAISAQQIAKFGDNDAAAALRRVTGISVEGGKYVYVRGLGDRYAKTTLNSAEIPGLDPSRNSVQMDMFPSNLIDNLLVFKTFSADLPGDFSGGFVNILTKDFPDRFVLQATTGMSYNTNASFNPHFLTYQGGKTDWLATDDGTRAMPKQADNLPFLGSASSNIAQAQALDAATKAFNKTMEPITKSPFLNQRYALSLGNQRQLWGNPLGFIVSLSYQNDNIFYKNGITGRYALAGTQANGLNTLLYLDDTQGTNNVLIGGLANISYKIGSHHKISLNLMRNQSGSSIARFQQGIYPLNFSNNYSEQFQTRSLQYVERSLNTVQLKGEHRVFGINNAKLEWHSAFSRAQQNEPDLRFFANDFSIQANGDTSFAINAAMYKLPSRFYRQLAENNLDNKIHLTLPFKQWAGLASKVKIGGSWLYKSRDFGETRLDYRSGTMVAPFNGSISDYLSNDRIGIIGQNEFGYVFGPVLQNASENRNTYSATQSVGAAYVMTDLQLLPKLRINTGIRYETTAIEVQSKDENVQKGEVTQGDWLTAVNLIYEWTPNLNIRSSYGRTLARPTFRELAPYASYDFIGDFILVGNPTLERTLINNFDFRTEWYPSTGEILAISAFYKQFKQPIEKVIVPRGNNEYSFRNVPQAKVMGLELEIRKRLGFFHTRLANWSVGFNASLIRSAVDIDSEELADIRAADPNYSATRQMFAQSPYLLNAILEYSHPTSMISCNISYSIFGKRLVLVSAGATPDVFEQPRGTLNVACSKAWGQSQQWRATLRGGNLLNPYFDFSSVFNGAKLPYQRYKNGVDISLSVSYEIR